MEVSLVYLPGQIVYLCPNPYPSLDEVPSVYEGVISTVNVHDAGNKMYINYGFLATVKHSLDGGSMTCNPEDIVQYYEPDNFYPTCQSAWKVYKDWSKRKIKTFVELKLVLPFNVGDTVYAQAFRSDWEVDKHHVLQDLDILRGKINAIDIELKRNACAEILYDFSVEHRKPLRGKTFRKTIYPYREHGLYRTEEEVREILEPIYAKRLEAKRKFEISRLEKKIINKQKRYMREKEVLLNTLMKLRTGDTECLIS